jgi:DNA-binding NtrC family response regulator
MAVAVQVAERAVVVVSSDDALRERLRASLGGMRWQVREAAGGAEAIAEVERQVPEAVLLDAWLPDIDAGEIAVQIEALSPGVDVLRVDGSSLSGRARSPRRHELLHALREATSAVVAGFGAVGREEPTGGAARDGLGVSGHRDGDAPHGIEELVGHSAALRELVRLVRLVAPRSATVLIEGETGTGKEVVAKALHRLSARANKPFVVLNCAAIPEALLEAELFGHTRGAFTGATHARTGRIEAAHGGTLFLDEIGEMPLPLQAKMLRFLEAGEIQRVGENEAARVDVRVIAATHQPLEMRAAEGTFRLDLYHRLAVFPVEVAPLRERLEDIPALAEHFLAALGRTAPRKTISAEALERLQEHHWPGNVRELAHVLERATILAADAPVIAAEHVRVRRSRRSHGHAAERGLDRVQAAAAVVAHA